MEDFKDVLEKWVQQQLKNYGIGIVTAELQNLAGEFLSICDDEDFKIKAVEDYTNIVMEKE